MTVCGMHVQGNTHLTPNTRTLNNLLETYHLSRDSIASHKMEDLLKKVEELSTDSNLVVYPDYQTFKIILKRLEDRPSVWAGFRTDAISKEMEKLNIELKRTI